VSRGSPTVGRFDSCAAPPLPLTDRANRRAYAELRALLTASSIPIKLQEDLVDVSAVANRPRPRLLPVRDPLWRQRVAARFGIPVLGVVVAVVLGWLIGHL